MTMRQTRPKKSLMAACMLPMLMMQTAGAIQHDVTDQQIDRMTNALVTAVPMDKMMDVVLEKNPYWPLKVQARQQDAAVLACIRGDINRQLFLRVKREEVVTYAHAHTDDFAVEIRVMESVAPVIGKLIAAGAERANSGRQYNPVQIMSSMNTEQMANYMRLRRDPRLADLRELTGVGQTLSNTPGGDPKSNGEALGMVYGMKLINLAMQDCKAPGDFFNNYFGAGMNDASETKPADSQSSGSGPVPPPDH